MLKFQLDLQFFSGEKTEKATPKKREDTRKKGQVAKSSDLNTAFILLLSFLVLNFVGEFFLRNAENFFRLFFEQYMTMEVAGKSFKPIITLVVKTMVVMLGPIMLASLVAGVAINYAQVGVLFTTEPLTPKFSKINPIEGFKRIYSIRALVELAKSMLKISLVGYVAYSIIRSNIHQVLGLSQKPIIDSFLTIFNLGTKIGIYCSIVLLVLSLFDYFYQRFDYEKNIRMSKQDIKDEYKKSEGDPLIKSKIKQKQREVAMRRMMQEIPKADVVITNPTHYAIALRYDETISDAPIVVAKGVDLIAQKIKLIAKENDVTMIENRPLARALYDQAEIGQQIPEQFFKTVAEILAYVYKLKKKSV